MAEGGTNDKSSNDSSNGNGSSSKGGPGRSNSRNNRRRGGRRGGRKGRGESASANDNTAAAAAGEQQPPQNQRWQHDKQQGEETRAGRGGRGRGRGGRGSRGGRGGRRGRGGGGRHNNRQSNGSSNDNCRSNNNDENNNNEPPSPSGVNNNTAAAPETAPDLVESNPPPVLPPLATQFLDLPSPAVVAETTSRRKDGGPVVLSRRTVESVHNTASALYAKNENHDPDAHMQSLSERLAEAALAEEDEDAPLPPAPAESVTKKKKRKKKTKKKEKRNNEHDDDDDDFHQHPDERLDNSPPPISTTDAFQNLPRQEVSITSATQVLMKPSTDGPVLPIRPTPLTADAARGGKKKKSKKKKKSTDDAVNRKAARRFNASVRECVEQGDPHATQALLYDYRGYALDHQVLETVLKAFVMAAMFEDALYCLRNCTVPDTLSTVQTERILTCLPQNLRNSSAYTAADMINQLCVATRFDCQTSRTYFLRIARGVALEFLEEVTSVRDRICSSQCERLVRSALCVVNSRLKRGKKPTELVVLAGEQLGVFLPDTMENRGIQTGDAVSILPYAGAYPMSAESLDRNMIEATVTNINPMVLRLQDKANGDLYRLLTEEVEGNLYRIDKLANRMGFNRQLAAAVAMASPLPESNNSEKPVPRDPRRPCPQLIKAITAMDENINMVLRRSGLPRGEEQTSTAALCAQAIPWSIEDENNEGMDQDAVRYTARMALEQYGALEGLNASQQRAVEGASTNRLTLVQGPPGTGKTAVAIRILQHWANLAAASSQNSNRKSPAPVLATSDSNIAVDNLVEGCAAVGLRVVRLGRPEAIRPELSRYCIDRPPSRDHPGDRNDNYGGGSHYKERAKQLKNAQVVCCTCIGSGGDILDSLGPLERVLVDEATQATEPAIIVPLMRGCRQLVLVGDHCQLPPTVLSTKAEEEGHGVPLFSRMVACGVPPYMLDTQYRMHPCIAMFPSDLFYGGLLKNGVSAPERRPLVGFPWPREEFPVAYMKVEGIEMDDGVSKYNEAEADAAVQAVKLLLEAGQCSVSDVAVVTPYAAQARLIRRKLRSFHAGPPWIEVSSVDGFQGREKEAVIFSAVRSNDYGTIGFTSDWRRVNVSFTRARRALIVIGNDVTLRRGDPDTWGPWLAWADAHGINMERPGQPRGRYDAEQLRRVRGGTTAAEMLKDVLERQQAQLRTAEQQQERAVRNTEGHIVGGCTDPNLETDIDSPQQQLSLEEDLAKMATTNWDDSSEEDTPLKHSISKATLASATSSNANTRSSTPTDAWDL